MYIMTALGWYELIPTNCPPLAPDYHPDYSEHFPKSRDYDRMFFTESGEDMRKHPMFGYGIHRYKNGG